MNKDIKMTNDKKLEEGGKQGFLEQDFLGDELLRVVDFQKIGTKQKIIKIEASVQECQLLIKRFKINGLSDLTAFCTIKQESEIQHVKFSLDVKLKAVAIQNCIVSLEPTVENIDVDFTVLFAGKKYFKDSEDETDFSEDDADVVFLGGRGQMKVNIGEIIAQHTALNLKLYPKKEGITGEELGTVIISEKEAENNKLQKKNPFDVLKILKE